MDGYTDEVLKKHITTAATEFYELVYDDPWLKKVFRNSAKELITAQQVDFIVQALGGPKLYTGRSPSDAHPHIYINEEMWELRENYLKQAMKKCNTPTNIQDKWLKIDNAFKKVILKDSPNELKPMFKTQELIIEPGPNIKKAV